MPGPGGHGGHGGPGGHGGHGGPGGHRGHGGPGGFGGPRGGHRPMPPHHHGYGMGHPPRRRYGCSGCLMPVIGVIGLAVLAVAMLF